MKRLFYSEKLKFLREVRAQKRELTDAKLKVLAAKLSHYSRPGLHICFPVVPTPTPRRLTFHHGRSQGKTLFGVGIVGDPGVRDPRTRRIFKNFQRIFLKVAKKTLFQNVSENVTMHALISRGFGRKPQKLGKF